MDPITLTILLVGTIVLTFLKMRNASPVQKYRLREFDVPTASESKPVPELFGTLKLHGNCIYYGNLRRRAITKNSLGFLRYTFIGYLLNKKITLGYSYYLTMAWVLARRVDEIYRVRMNQKQTWLWSENNDRIIASGEMRNITTGPTTEDDGTPNPKSPVYFYLGDQATADAALVSKSGYDNAYLEAAYVFFNDVFVGRDTSVAPAYEFMCRRTRILDFLDLESDEDIGLVGNEAEKLEWETLNEAPYDWTDYAEINGVLPPAATGDKHEKYQAALCDANPAFILYYLLRNVARIPCTSSDTTLAFSDIDIPSFQRAAVTLATEKLGMSIFIDDFTELQSIIEDIKRHINAVLYEDAFTSKYTIKLIRDDYDHEAVPTITEHDCKGLKIMSTAWLTTASQLTLVYSNRSRDWAARPVTFLSPVSRNLINMHRPIDVDLTGFTHPDAIRSVAPQLMRAHFAPLTSIQFSISSLNEIGENGRLQPGDVVRLDLTTNEDNPLQLNAIYRVLAASSPDGNTSEISIDAVEDVFDLDDVMSFTLREPAAPPEKEADLTNATAGHILVVDAPPEIGLGIMVLATKPDTDSLCDAFQVEVGPDESTDDEREWGMHSQFSIWGRLTGALNPTTLVDGLATVGVDSLSEAEEAVTWNLSDEDWGRLKRCILVVWGDPDDREWEIASVKTCAQTSPGDPLTLTGFVRCLFGTGTGTTLSGIPTWPDNAEIYILPEDYVFQLPTAVVNSFLTYGGDPPVIQPIDVIVTPTNPTRVGEPTVVSHTYGFRSETPYAPTGFTATCEDPFTDPTTITLEWQPRRRGRGAAQIPVNAFPTFWFGSEPEGQFVIERGSDSWVTSNTTLEVSGAAGDVFELRCRVEGHYSPVVTTTAV